MSLLQISIEGCAPRLHGSPQALRPALKQALTQSSGAITFLVHGFKYEPGRGNSCPHNSLFSLTCQHPDPKIVSWPKHLRPGGLVIGIGWSACGAIWNAYDRAASAGAGLAEVISILRQLAPERAQHIMAHSLGARVALRALSHLNDGDISSLILLAAAEYRSETARALASPAGQAAEVLHVTSGENDMYDFLLERLVAPPHRGDRALGTETLGNARTLLLDDCKSLAALGRLGFRIAGPSRKICHWSPYLRPGIFALYRALIRGDLDHDTLALALHSRRHQRWSRVLPQLLRSAPLPLAKDAAV